jgi:hypothetical protein
VRQGIEILKGEEFHRRKQRERRGLPRGARLDALAGAGREKAGKQENPGLEDCGRIRRALRATFVG